jgi:hypothetical protein
MKELIRKFETELNKIKPKTADNKKALDSIIEIFDTKYKSAIERSKQGGFISLEEMKQVSTVLRQIQIDMVTHVHVLDQASIYSDKILASGELDLYREAWRNGRS